MFSIYLSREEGHDGFTATVMWTDDGTSPVTKTYSLTSLTSAPSFHKLSNFNLLDTRNSCVNGEGIQGKFLMAAERRLNTCWSSSDENERIGLLVFLANIFVAGTEVAAKTAADVGRHR